MMAAGVVVMHTQPGRLGRSPADVRTELRNTYAQACSRPRPPVRALPAVSCANGTFGQPRLRESAVRARGGAGEGGGGAVSW